MSVERAIDRGLAALAVDVKAPAAPSRLSRFTALLCHWNRVYNLTAVEQPDEMVVRHILDSLSILPWLQGPRLLDVGSGAGLPGIPLAIARPDLHFYLLDSSAKRTRFMIQSKAQLGLDNVQVIRARVEAYRPDALFDSVLSRAFASLAELLRQAGRLCAPQGRLLAMKGKYPQAELDQIPVNYRLVGVYRLTVPGLDADRHLIHLVPVVSAPA